MSAYLPDVPVARDVRHVGRDVGTRAAEEQQLKGRLVHHVEELLRCVPDVALHSSQRFRTSTCTSNMSYPVSTSYKYECTGSHRHAERGIRKERGDGRAIVIVSRNASR